MAFFSLAPQDADQHGSAAIARAARPARERSRHCLDIDAYELSV